MWLIVDHPSIKFLRHIIFWGTMKMVQVTKLLIITLFPFIFASPGFSGGLNFGSGRFGNHQMMPPHHKFNYSTKSYGLIKKHNLKFRRTLKHNAKKQKHPYRFIYDPRYFYYGWEQSEKNRKVEVNVNIISDKKEESNEHPVKKDHAVSPPHIVTLSDIAPNGSDTHLRSAKNPESVILIHGTRVSETKLPSD
jgi:hypothetical protein